MRPESADLRPKRPDLGSERAKLGLEWADFTPKGADFRPERLDGGDKQTNKWSHRGTNKSAHILQDFVPFQAAAQKTEEMLLMIKGPKLLKS